MNTNCLTLGLILIKKRLWHINIIYEIEAHFKKWVIKERLFRSNYVLLF